MINIDGQDIDIVPHNGQLWPIEIRKENGYYKWPSFNTKGERFLIAVPNKGWCLLDPSCRSGDPDLKIINPDGSSIIISDAPKVEAYKFFT